MEVQPVTFNTFRTVFLQNESLILAIPRVIQDFARHRGLQSRFAMAFIVFTMLFILIFPTLGSAMTGYSGNVEAYVPDSDNNNILFSSFRPLYYVVHDGNRVGLTDNYEVAAYPENGAHYCKELRAVADSIFRRSCYGHDARLDSTHEILSEFGLRQQTLRPRPLHLISASLQCVSM